MRRTLTCPKCQGRKIWRIERFATESDNRVGWDLHVVYGRSIASNHTTTGKFDAYICHGCGYTEWYAHSFADLRPDPSVGVHFVDGDALPYR